MKKVYLFILATLLFLISTVSVNADVVVKNRDDLKNYGVNKKWEINSSNINNVLATDYVDAKEKIYDFAGILSDYEIDILKSEIDEFISKYNIELVILTVDKYYYNDSYNETLAADFYDYNDFGLEYENYDGILIYRNAYKLDPYYDIYTFGKAQLYFDDKRYDEVLDDAYVSLHSGKYLEGFTMFIDYIEEYISDGIPRDMKYKYIDDMGVLRNKFKPPYLLAFIISSIVTFIIINIMISKNKMVKKETKADIYLDMETIDFTVRKNDFSHSRTTSVVVSSNSGGGSSGGGHSSRGSSGGGHSSGGGRHG